MSTTSQTGLLILIVLVLGITALVGGHFGAQYTGVNMGYNTELPEDGGEVTWVSSSLDFMVDLFTFNIDAVPAWLSVFYYLISVGGLWLLIRTIRGN